MRSPEDPIGRNKQIFLSCNTTPRKTEEMPLTSRNPPWDKAHTLLLCHGQCSTLITNIGVLSLFFFFFYHFHCVAKILEWKCITDTKRLKSTGLDNKET